MYKDDRLGCRAGTKMYFIVRSGVGKLCEHNLNVHIQEKKRKVIMRGMMDISLILESTGRSQSKYM